MITMYDTHKKASLLTSSPPAVSKHPTLLAKYLTRVHLFSKLQPDVQKTLIASAIPRRFDAGQVIYLEGEPAEHIFIIESGWVKATRISRDGREQALLFLHPGEIFGDVAVFSHNIISGHSHRPRNR